MGAFSHDSPSHIPARGMMAGPMVDKMSRTSPDGGCINFRCLSQGLAACIGIRAISLVIQSLTKWVNDLGFVAGTLYKRRTEPNLPDQSQYLFILIQHMLFVATILSSSTFPLSLRQSQKFNFCFHWPLAGFSNKPLCAFSLAPLAFGRNSLNTCKMCLNSLL